MFGEPDQRGVFEPSGPLYASSAMGRTHPRLRRAARMRERMEPLERRPSRALSGVAGTDARVLLLGLEQLADDTWAVLAAAGIALARVADTADAVRALTAQEEAQVVIVDARRGPGLTAAVRARRELSATHIIVCVALDSRHELRAALDAGADDVMRVPFSRGSCRLRCSCRRGWPPSVRSASRRVRHSAACSRSCERDRPTCAILRRGSTPPS